MSIRPLSEIVPLKDSIAELASKLKGDGTSGSDFGLQLAKTAESFGITTKEYLLLAGAKHSDKTNDGLNVYEKLLVELNLPIRNDFERGVYLQAASDTFATYPGTRALFPEVIDDVVRWANRQDQFEQVAPMLANSRTINGVELLSTIVDDDSKDRDTYMIAEGTQIPVRTIRTSEQRVRIWKHGYAIRSTYEFNRRASIDMLVPYANRIARDLEISKVKVATGILVNGDGAYGAAPVVNQSSYNTVTGVTATNNKISWPHLLKWLVTRAQAGTPVDTIAMNWDGYFEWMMLFSVNQTSAGNTPAESLQKAGVSVGQNALSLAIRVTPILSSAVPAGKLIGFSKGDTLEELIEANSNIQETERAIRNQTVTVVKTENTGYRLVFGDTRSIYNFAA